MAVCLVTGGAGFIGSHLVEALVARGDRVRVLDNLSTGHLKNLAAVLNQIELIEGDICDPLLAQQATAGVDYVFHLAAMVSVPKSMLNPVEAEQVNAFGTLNLLQAAKTAGARCLALSSTCAVYGDEPTLPKTEMMLPYPKSPYAVGKLAAEHYCRVFSESFGLKTVVFRYFNIFGPRQDPSSPYSGVISIFVDKLLQGIMPTIFGDGQQTRDFVYVADIVRANLLAVESDRAAGQILNICTGRQTTIKQLLETLCQLLGHDFYPEYGPPRLGDIVYSYGAAGRAQDLLGWQPQVSFEAGLRELVVGLQSTRK